MTPDARSTHRNVRWGNKGYGFLTDEKLYLVRCGACQRENYGPAVASGQCAWCGDIPETNTLEVL